jgi:hypothetical protein
MSAKRRGHACEIIGNDMYVIGGFGGNTWGTPVALPTTQVYDARADRWRTGPELGLRRAFGYSGVLHGTIYSFAGMRSVRIQCDLQICCVSTFAYVCKACMQRHCARYRQAQQVGVREGREALASRVLESDLVGEWVVDPVVRAESATAAFVSYNINVYADVHVSQTMGRFCIDTLRTDQSQTKVLLSEQ